MDLSDKKIVLICPKFYGYEELIVEELRRRGAIVYLIYENLEWVKVSYRLVYVYLPQYKTKLVKNYYKKELQGILHDLDFFVAIRGSSLRADIMKWIISSVPSYCKFIMYQWDGVRNNEVALEISPYFDRVLTFDKTDALKRNWIYRPLFFVPQYVNHNIEKDIDVLFICALHSKRAHVLNQLKKVAEDTGYNLKAVVNMNKVLYYKYKYINKKDEVIEADNKDLTFKPLSIQESYNLYSRSKAVVDYTNTNQTGYTMRTIESFGNSCKLVTNNALIVESDFYIPDNIHIYDEERLDIPNDFIEMPLKKVQAAIFERYTLKRWVDDIIGIDG